MLRTMLLGPARVWYRSELARRIGTRPSSLQRELESLAAAGVLRHRRDGNRSCFEPNPDCPFMAELRGLLEKTVGAAPLLSAALSPFAAKIAAAFIFGSVAGGRERAESDVDLFVVGDITVKDLVPVLRGVEEQLGRAVDVHRYTEHEVAEQVRTGGHFVTAVLGRDKIFVIGDQRDLDSAARTRPG